ncbi:3-deoxy-D-manno-octulosonic acid transferase [Silvibacterium dinghuense]|uniref:3-deoxy-D-manno-octulosonic acid transferase n=1 Tax=Silvibacterium dinghuense TaxID=1560006 RepID=A0A4Q1SHP9_9BACT|nr:3-deoxy-D-manno-octulosonic acid transferase [Silvibacterium dinghuense]RXS97094.1 3-deoxy-D-manno-octulosonic acid transferase [Silvibacterium dinghuense]GGG96165.1 3-deoxy-D-manno-octulosonic acid transferase [Silvibacterium dinghuense]
MFLLYSVALTIVLLLSAPFWLLRMATSGKYREGLGERLGRIPKRLRAPAPGQPVVWLHAVSVGETLAAGSLILRLRSSLPGYRIVVSTTTRTGQKLAREKFGADSVFYFPLDFAFAVRAWLRFLRPRLIVLLESEFWPRMLHECGRMHVPIAVVNARISDRSWPRYQRLRWLWRPLLAPFALTLAQSEQDAERLMAIGAGHVEVAGNLKFDIRVRQEASVTTALRRVLTSGQLVVVCGSTLEGEEELLLNAVPPEAIVILAPRHPERFATVAQLLRRRDARWIRRSEWVTAPSPLKPGSVFLLDSIGELASVYSLATIAFVGGSLVQAGGHNPLEPAQFAVPIVMGPHYENFRAIVELLRSLDAIRVAPASTLKAMLAELLSYPDEAAAMGERARAIFDAEAGGTDRTLARLLALLGERAGDAA